MFKKYLLLLIIGVTICYPDYLNATDLTFSLLDDIIIEGNNFGNGGLYDYVCFNDDQSCYSYNNSGILKWTDNEITVSPLRDIPTVGTLIVYAGDEIFRFSYKIRPVLLGVFNENSYPVTNVCSGQELYIAGIGIENSQVYAWNKRGTSKKKLGIRNIEDASREFVKNLGYPNLYGLIEYVEFDTSEIENIKSIYLDNSGLESESVGINIYDYISNDAESCRQHYLYDIGYDKLPVSLKNKGDGITVAIIDDGLNHNHSDLKKSLWSNKYETPNNGVDDDSNGYIDDVHGWNFSSDSYLMDDFGGHGTMIAGIIAAQSNNGIGITGIAPGTDLMTLIINHEDENARSQVSESIIYAVDNGANIINLSFGNIFNSQYDEGLDNAIKYANDRNVIITAAAGNGDYTNTQDRDLGIYPSSPVCNDLGVNAVDGVAALDFNGSKADFSDYGEECVDYSLPGVDIFSTSHPAFSETGVEYDWSNGTSFSSPILAGIYSLIRSNNLGISAEGIRKMVYDFSSEMYSDDLGRGINLENYGTIDTSKYESYRYDDIKINKANSKQKSSGETNSLNNSIVTPDSGALSKNITNDELVSWLYSNGFTKYNSLEKFNPNNKITREQASKFLSKYAGVIGLDLIEDIVCEFNDVNNADYTLLPFIYESCSYGLLKGSDNSFYPFKNISNIESVTVGVRSVFGVQDETMTPWYSKYLEIGNENSIKDLNINNLNLDISRIEFGRVLYNSSLLKNS